MMKNKTIQIRLTEQEKIKAKQNMRILKKRTMSDFVRDLVLNFEQSIMITEIHREICGGEKQKNKEVTSQK